MKVPRLREMETRFESEPIGYFKGGLIVFLF